MLDRNEDMAAASVRPRGSGYNLLKARHKQAYDHLNKALEIDEAGVGESVCMRAMTVYPRCASCGMPRSRES